METKVEDERIEKDVIKCPGLTSSTEKSVFFRRVCVCFNPDGRGVGDENRVRKIEGFLLTSICTTCLSSILRLTTIVPVKWRRKKEREREDREERKEEKKDSPTRCDFTYTPLHMLLFMSIFMFTQF